MIYKIENEQHFQVLSSSFSVSPSESGYVLMFSANGFDFSEFTTVAAGQNKQFVNMSNGNYYYLSGNTDTVEVNWERECHGGGGGGTAGVSSLDGQTGALTTKTINGNAILGSGNIEIEGGEEKNYQIVDALSAVTDAQEGTIVYVKSYDKTASGATIVRDNNAGDGWFSVTVVRDSDSWETNENFYGDSNGVSNDSWQNILGKWVSCRYGSAYGVSGDTGYTVYYYTNSEFHVKDTQSEQPGITITLGDLAMPIPVPGEKNIYNGSAWEPYVYNLSEMTAQEQYALRDRILDEPTFFAKHEFYYKRNDGELIKFSYSFNDGYSVSFRGDSASNNKYITYGINGDGNIYTDEKWYADNSTFLLVIKDFTGGTPYWGYRSSFDNMKNLKDRSYANVACPIYLFYDSEGEYKPYAVATGFKFDNGIYTVYFDDVEFNNTRYRAVYTFPEASVDTITTDYWDTFANYINSL